MTEQLTRPERSKSKLGIYRILALDTIEHIDLLRQAAIAAGHEVVAVTKIDEAMDFLNRRDHVDIVVSAVHLESESVFDFLKQLKGAPIHKDVKFMMLCSDASDFALAVDQSVRTAAAIMGVDKYVTMEHYDVKRLMKEITAILPDRLPIKETDPEGA